MNLSKPVNPIRNYAFGSVITALILLSPVVAFLMAIAAEMLIDSLMVGGTSGLRRRRRRYRIGSVPQVLATSRGRASVEAGTGARRNVHCCRTNVIRPTPGSVHRCNAGTGARPTDRDRILHFEGDPA